MKALCLHLAKFLQLPLQQRPELLILDQPVHDPVRLRPLGLLRDDLLRTPLVEDGKRLSGTKEIPDEHAADVAPSAHRCDAVERPAGGPAHGRKEPQPS